MSWTDAGLRLVFALALCVPSISYAELNDGDEVWEHPFDDPDHECADHDFDHDGHASNPENKLAAKFGVDQSEIAALRSEKLGYGEIDHTLTLAERMPGGITDENVGAVLEMRQDQKMGWGQIAHSQGTTLGKAKRDFPTQPEVEPVPHDSAPGEPAPVAQPKSLNRSGKSTLVASGKSGSSHGHGAKSATSRGSSNRSSKAMTSSPGAARSGGGHAYGRGGSGGSVGKANGNGKAKGPK
jgi:hypothetical protein